MTSFSAELEDWLRSDQPKTLGQLSEVFGQRSFAVAIVLLMILPATPLPTGGITHVFELFAVVIAAQMVLGRTRLWLPARFANRELKAVATAKTIPKVVGTVRWLERISRPRGVHAFRGRVGPRLIGLVLIGLCVAAALAPPFSGLDTLPALGAVIVGLSVLLEDVAMLGVGAAIGCGGIVVIVAIGASFARVIGHLF